MHRHKRLERVVIGVRFGKLHYLALEPDQLGNVAECRIHLGNISLKTLFRVRCEEFIMIRTFRVQTS